MYSSLNFFVCQAKKKVFHHIFCVLQVKLQFLQNCPQGKISPQSTGFFLAGSSGFLAKGVPPTRRFSAKKRLSSGFRSLSPSIAFHQIYPQFSIISEENRPFPPVNFFASPCPADARPYPLPPTDKSKQKISRLHRRVQPALLLRMKSESFGKFLAVFLQRRSGTAAFCRQRGTMLISDSPDRRPGRSHRGCCPRCR